jgi:hypothetical protein
MIRSFAVAVALVAAALVSGCAGVPMAAPEADAAAKQFRADPGKAGLYVYRNETFGAALTMPVLLDNAPIGDTASKTYLYRQIAPGPHVVTAKTEGDSTVSIDAKPGATYFVWQEVKMGMMKGRSELHLVDEATGKAGVAECKLVQ